MALFLLFTYRSITFTIFVVVCVYVCVCIFLVILIVHLRWLNNNYLIILVRIFNKLYGITFTIDFKLFQIILDRLLVCIYIRIMCV